MRNQIEIGLERNEDSQHLNVLSLFLSSETLAS